VRAFVLAASLVALTGCQPTVILMPAVPSTVQPEEYDVYHALLVQSLRNHPEKVTLLVSQWAVPLASEPGQVEWLYGRCFPPKVESAFASIGSAFYPLGDGRGRAWLTVPDGRSFSIQPDGEPPKEPFREFVFSRVIFDKNHNEAYFNAEINHCDQSCGGNSMLWHAYRNRDQWILKATRCYGMS
jgi:hypothetical protein